MFRLRERNFKVENNLYSRRPCKCFWTFSQLQKKTWEDMWAIFHLFSSNSCTFRARQALVKVVKATDYFPVSLRMDPTCGFHLRTAVSLSLNSRLREETSFKIVPFQEHDLNTYIWINKAYGNCHFYTKLWKKKWSSNIWANYYTGN